jgi:hypothetical protein
MRKLALAAGLVLLGAVLALAFVGYRQPDLLLETINVRYCG